MLAKFGLRWWWVLPRQRTAAVLRLGKAGVNGAQPKSHRASFAPIQGFLRRSRAAGVGNFDGMSTLSAPPARNKRVLPPRPAAAGITIVAFTAVLYIVELVDLALHGSLNNDGVV